MTAARFSWSISRKDFNCSALIRKNFKFLEKVFNDSQGGDFCIFSKVAALTGKECDLRPMQFPEVYPARILETKNATINGMNAA